MRMPIKGFSFPLPQAYSCVINHCLLLKMQHFSSWGPLLWAQVPAGGGPCYHRVLSGLRGLCTSLQELWRWSLCLLHAACPGLWNRPCWASTVGGTRSASLPWDIWDLYLHISLQSLHLLCCQPMVTIQVWRKQRAGFQRGKWQQVLWIKCICFTLKKKKSLHGAGTKT